ncbi:MAG: hypothetical protein MUP81_04625 [Dehalococcoidia bacterium]|nr:hypothetical protein [Dehalococcoidia bacterium]
MKLALIYDPTCPKLLPTAYSQTYRDQFMALPKRFETTSHITTNCSAKDIDADVIVIYDVHSSHHIEIDGLSNHPSIKYSYFNDPHQEEFSGRYINGPAVHKLGPEQRVHRELERGTDFIICPYTDGFFKYIAPHIGPNAEKMLFWFPPAPSVTRFPDRMVFLNNRRHRILGNGALNDGGIGGYEFRQWAYSQRPETFYLKHTLERPDVPRGEDYGKLLSSFAASLALNGLYIVPKYQEIPLAGCVCFAQEQEDYRKMGFKDGENCIFVNQENYKRLAMEFLSSKGTINDDYFQRIATSGRELIESKWTAECFADALYEHAKLKGTRNERKY